MHDAGVMTASADRARLESLGEFITVAHGNGGRLTRELVETVFAHHFGGALDINLDAVPLSIPNGEIVVTTDGFIVEPLVFPGGTIGSLAVNGTVNDLAVAGATPFYLTLSAFIEEGLEIATLDALIGDAAAAARASGVGLVAGDTKVVRRGEGGGLYLGMTGVGVRARGVQLAPHHVRSGDRLLVSGTVGDHGAAVLLAREQFGLRGQLRSDCASVVPIAQALLAIDGLRFMRDPTRGGLATVAHDIVRASGFGVRLVEASIPVSEPVSGVCEILGFDPLMLACEGRVLSVVSAQSAKAALTAMRDLGCSQAAIVGTVVDEPLVALVTEVGERIVEELEHDPLPRIC
jgi:hydrogenase expression/formation protein HypE